MLPRKVTVGPLTAASANNIAASQTPAGAGDLTLTAAALAGTVPDHPRRVLFTPAGAEAANGTIWTVYGLDWNNNTVSEVVTGVNNPSTVATKYDFKRVTRIAVNKAQAGAVTVGTNGVASSRPIYLDPFARAPIGMQATVSGTVNYTVQQTVQDLNDVGYVNATWLDHPDPNMVGATVNVQGNYGYLPQWCRITINSGTGTVELMVVQAGG
jgi:hypothetical protein